MIFIGTTHLDPNGWNRLGRLLLEIMPRKITIEAPSGLSLDEICSRINDSKEKYQSAVKKKFGEVHPFYEEFLDCYGYDLLLPIRFGESSGAEVYPVDHPEREATFCNSIDDPLTQIPENGHLNCRKNMDLSSHLGYYVIPEYDGIEISTYDRELHMSNMIHQLQPTIHIGGAGHIFEDIAGNTPLLYRSHSDSLRVRLCEADLIPLAKLLKKR